jgi:hypothetical protein
LIKPGGALVGLLANNIAPGASPWSWTVAAPAVAGEQYKIRVRAVDGTTEGESAEFTVTSGGTPGGNPYFIMLAPNGNESWDKGTNKFISWTSANMTVNCRLLLLKDNQVVGTIKDSLSPGNGGSAVPWKVGEFIGGSASSGTGYKIRIESIDGLYSDTSDNAFTITAPPLVFHPVDQPKLVKLTLLPDLIVCLNWFGETPYIYQHQRVYVRVRNIGLANAPPSIFKVYVEGHGTLYYQSPWLAPNAEYNWSQLYEWKSCGHKTVRVTVDPEGLIAESNENNNLLEGRIEVTCTLFKSILLEEVNCSDPNQHY